MAKINPVLTTAITRRRTRHCMSRKAASSMLDDATASKRRALYASKRIFPGMRLDGLIRYWQGHWQGHVYFSCTICLGVC